MPETFTLAIPGGASSGDTLAAVIFSDQAIVAPAGWTEFHAGRAGGIYYSAASRQLSAADISARASWGWTLAAPTRKLAFDTFVFANITGIDAAEVAAYETPVATMDAPSLDVSQNEMVFAFWAALNPTEINVPVHAGDMGGVFARGGISHVCAIYTLGANGPTGAQRATLAVPSAGLAAQAALRGAGSHIVASAGGALAA